LRGLYYRMRRVNRPDALGFKGTNARNRLFDGPNIQTIWEADPTA
jgi:hypothetical protein